jgi:xylan 1,4-beta-xylosidase
MRRIVRTSLMLFLLCAAAYGAAAKTYSNPVLVDTYSLNRAKPPRYHGILGIGDPAVISYEGKYYLYPTGDNRSYRVYISDDLIHWKKGPTVFRNGEKGVWAPDVFYDPDDHTFYLYYTVNRRIGVAAADRPDGVFRDLGTLVRNGIDAHIFRDDDGSYFLYYARYPKFAIFVQPMSSPVRTRGDAVELLFPSEAWEMRDKPVTEAPWMIKRKGVYYLLYSGGSADSEHYAIGYATAENPTGPFVKYRGNPVVREGNGIFGPGHLSVVRDRAGAFWMVYHQQKDATRGWNRIICIDPLWFDGKGVLHARATRGTPMPAPVTSEDSE